MGPRLHDYSIPSNVTQVRPGLVSVPTTVSVPQATQGIAVRGTSPVAARGTAPVPIMPVPASNNAYAGYRGSGGASESWSSSRHTNGSHYAPSSYGGVSVHTNGSPYPHSHSPSEERGHGPGRQSHAAPPAASGGGGWSLPRSSLRSVSVSSQSRSRSNSASEESVDVDVVDVLDDYGGGRYAFNGRNTITRMWKREEDEMSVGFSVREEDEENHVVVVSGKGRERRMETEEWDGMEMEMDMD